jgi:hypothetical protein
MNQRRAARIWDQGVPQIENSPASHCIAKELVSTGFVSQPVHTQGYAPVHECIRKKNMSCNFESCVSRESAIGGWL